MVRRARDRSIHERRGPEELVCVLKSPVVYTCGFFYGIASRWVCAGLARYYLFTAEDGLVLFEITN